MSSSKETGPPPVPGQARIWIGGLGDRTKESDLRNIFGDFGKIVDVKLRSSSKDVFAFVEFKEQKQAQKALEEMDQSFVGGRRIKCDWAEYKGPNAQLPKRERERIEGRRHRSRSYSRGRRRRSPRRDRYRRSRAPRYRSRSPPRRYRRSPSPRRRRRRSRSSFRRSISDRKENRRFSKSASKKRDRDESSRRFSRSNSRGSDHKSKSRSPRSLSRD